MRIEERFWSKVAKSDGCWEWKAGKNQKGYGLFHVGRATRSAHRIAWEITSGTIPEGLLVLHKCDNPPCVKPEHLFLGTQFDNMADMVFKGRHKYPRKDLIIVMAMKADSAAGASIASLSMKYRLSEVTVSAVLAHGGSSMSHLAPRPAQ